MADATAPPDRADAPPTAPAFDVFLSYNSLDRPRVMEVRNALAAHGLAAFFDREGLNPGLPWQPELESAIARSRAVAVLLGPNGLGVWQNRELALALDRQARGEKTGGRLPVIPVPLPGFRPDDPRHEPPALLMLNTAVDLSAGLLDEAAVEPLARAVRGQSSPTAPGTKRGCPYRGLRPFREEDAPLFFGRETFASALLEKARALPLLAVVGPSGSGKSSVVQAGLVPLLRLERSPGKTWGVVAFTPGHRPFHRLAAALVATWQPDATRRTIEGDVLGEHLAARRAPALEAAFAQALDHSERAERLLLVVDQFEELFTLTPEPDRPSFAEALLAASAASPVTLALTLRADYFSPAIALSRPLSDAIGRGIVTLGPMGDDELRRAVEEPARGVGVAFQPNLVDLILADVAGQPGRLPLLEFALTELWGHERGPILTRAAYEAIGRVEGAIGQTAERVFAGLPPGQHDVALRALTRLVRVASAGEEGADTRQRVRLVDLGAAARPAMMTLVEHRLLVAGRDEASGDETIEVAHEALIRGWARLRDRINAEGERAFLHWRQDLDHLMGFYRRSKDDGALLRGAPLVEALRRARLRPDDLNDEEHAFIKRSARDPSTRRRRARAAWAATAALAILGASAWGWRLWTRSDAFQVQEVFRKAPPLVRSGDPAAVEWLAVQFLLGRERETLAEAARSEDPFLCSNLIEAASFRLQQEKQDGAVGRAATELAAEAGRLPDAGRRSAAISRAAELLVGVGRTAEALSLAEGIEDQDGRARALDLMAFRSLLKGQIPLAVRAAEGAANASKGIKDPPERVSSLANSYAALMAAGRFDLALARVGREDDRDEATRALGTALLLLAFDPGGSGEPPPAGLVARLAPEVLREVANMPDLAARSGAQVSVVVALAQSGSAAEAATLARQIADPKERSSALVVVAEALADRGRLMEALAVAGEIPDELQRPRELMKLAELLAKAGRADDAARAVTLAVPLVSKLKDALDRSSQLARAAGVLAQAGKADAAADVATTAMEAAFEVQLSPLPEDPLDESFRVMVKAGRGEAAISLARRLENRSESGPLSIAAAAFAEVGQIDKALLLARDAKALLLATEKAGDWVSPRWPIMQSLARRLIRWGRTDRALEIADRVSDPTERVEMLSIIAEAQAMAGQAEPARATAGRAAAAALEVVPTDLRPAMLRSAMVALAESGSIDAALALADRISVGSERVEALDSLASDLLNAGWSSAAAKVAASAAAAIPPGALGPAFSLALGRLAFTLVHTGQSEMAVKVAERLDRIEDRSEPFAEAAKQLAGAARIEAARAVAVRIIDDRLRSQALAAVARAQALKGELLDARLTAEECGSLMDRLSAYTAIVEDYYARSDPKWKAAFGKGSPRETVPLPASTRPILGSGSSIRSPFDLSAPGP